MNSSMTVELLREGSPPVFLARASGITPPKWLDDWYMKYWIELSRAGKAPQGVVTRGVDLNRLDYVLSAGVDVPIGRPLWVCQGLDKAWEYGGERKLVLILSGEALAPSHRVLAFDAPVDEIEGCRRQFRTCLRCEGDREFWFSNLDESDCRMGTPYEVAYCRFPARDPKECLLALLVVLPPGDEIAQLGELADSGLASADHASPPESPLAAGG